MSKQLQDYIKELVSFVEKDADFQERDARIHELNERRFCKRAPKIPAEFRKTASDYRSPFIFDVLRRAPGLTSTVLPTPKVTPLKSGPKAQENSSLREEWLKAAYIRMDRENTIYHRIMDSLSADGCACWKVITDKHTWASVTARKKDETEEEYLERVGEHRKQHFPFYWEHAPISTVYPFYDENGLCEVLQITRQSAARVAKRYGITKDSNKSWRKGKRGDIPQGECKHIEYWSRTEFAYQVDDFLVGKGKHEYKRPPYFIAPLVVTGSGNPATDFYGLAWPMIYLQDIFDTLITTQLNWAIMNGFPYAALEPISDNAIPLDPKDMIVKLEHGKPYVPPPGYKLVWVTPPPTGQDMASLRELIKQAIDQVGLAPVLFGDFPSDTSGTAANTMVAVAKSIFGPGLRNIARAFDDMAAFIQEQVEQLGDDVPVFAVSQERDSAGKYINLGPDDIKGYYQVEHTLEPVLPAEQQLKYMHLADAQARGYVPKTYVLEEGMNINNPERVLDEVWLENAEADPRVQQVIMTEALKPYIQTPQSNPAAAAMAAMGQGAPGKNVPVAAGGPGASVAPGIQQGLQPGQRPATRPANMGRG
jgi:hypothetical protein